MVPNPFILDTRLSDADFRVLMVLVKVAWQETALNRCVATIGQMIGKKKKATQTALRNLEWFGYIRYEPDPSDGSGRRIVLCWRLGDLPAPTHIGCEDSPRERNRQRASRQRGGANAPAPPGANAPPLKTPPERQTSIPSQFANSVPIAEQSVSAPIVNSLASTPAPAPTTDESTRRHVGAADSQTPEPSKHASVDVHSLQDQNHDQMRARHESTGATTQPASKPTLTLPAGSTDAKGQPSREWLRARLDRLEREPRAPDRPQVLDELAVAVSVWLRDERSVAGNRRLLAGAVAEQGASRVLGLFWKTYDRIESDGLKKPGAVFRQELEWHGQTDDLHEEMEIQGMEPAPRLTVFRGRV